MSHSPSLQSKTFAMGLIAAFACSLPILSAADSPSTEYEIVHEEIRDLLSYGKLKQSVVIQQDATEEELRSVLLALRAAAFDRSWKSDKAPGVWIYLYPDKRTANSKPDQWLAMLANSPGGKPEIKISTTVTQPISTSKEAAGRELIGSWRYTSIGFHWVTTLFRESGKIKEETKYWDGSSSVKVVVKSRHPEGVKYADPKNKHGEYFVVYPNGNLGMYDRDGRFGVATPVQ